MVRGAIPKRAFGPHLETTVVGFGGGALSGDGGGYGFGSLSDHESMTVLEHAYELGIRLYDTAPIYGFGESERRLGDFFRAHPSFLKDVVLVTKLGVTWDEQKSVRVDNSPETTRRMLDASLKRLGVDRVDVYMIHWPDPRCPVERTMETLVRLKEEGCIGSLAASNFDQELVKRAETVAPLDILQAPFSLVEASARDSIFPMCGPKRGFMSYGTLAKGILAGTVTAARQFEASDFRARSDQTKRQLHAVQGELEEFFSVARGEGLTNSELAVAWALSFPKVSTALCGSKRVEQVDEVVRGAQISLRPEVKTALDRLAVRATAALAAL
jgi:aryl-alcohol dehydrogenase-like predicted oxidoreductase